MGFIDWLGRTGKAIGGAVTKGMDWIGQKVVRPAADFLRKVPVVGDIVRAADPIGNVLAKDIGAASDALNNVPAEKRRRVASLGEHFDAAKAVPATIAATKRAITAM